MPDTLRLPLDFDAARLLTDLEKIPSDLWIAHFNTADYEGGWSALALYSPTGSTSFITPMLTDAFELRETPLLDDCSYFKEVVEAFECPKRVVRLLKLHAGGRIKEHDDPRLCFEDGVVRIHIPVRTNPGVECYLGGERLIMHPGESWYADFTLPHRVENESTEDRVHLVMDCVVDDWLRGVFDKAEPR